MWTDIPNWVLALLIFLEWGYVIYWTRTVGKRTLANLARAITLRRGRAGVVPSVAEQAAETLGGDAPNGGAADASELIDGIAAQLGVEPEKLAGLAQQFLGPASSGAGAAGGTGLAGLPAAIGAAGGADPIGMLLQGFLNGSIDKETAIAAGVPLFMKMLRSGGASGGAPSGSGVANGGEYWG